MRDVTQLHPTLQAKIKTLQSKCNAAGYKIGISECLRTVAEQDALYAQGRTKSGSIVTNAKGSTYSSMHQWGVAFDFYRNDGKGAYNNNDKFFDKVGAIGVSIGLEWGGNWKSIVDKPHFQLPDWGSTTSKLKSTYKTPDAFMKTWSGTTATVTTESTEVSVADYKRKYFIKDVQKALGVKVDGLVGVKTLSATPTLSSTKNNKHPVVRYVQKYFKHLGYTEIGTIDGVAGPKFDAVIVSFKKKKNCKNTTPRMASKGAVWKYLLGVKKS